MKKKNRRKKPTKLWFIQDWGSYSAKTPVFIGYSIPEITKVIKRLNIKEKVKELWIQDHNMTSDIFANKSGGIWKNSGFTLLFLPKLEDTWDLYETILHECFHLVIYQLGQQRMFINDTTKTIEEEGLAYQIEFLFREIRRKIQKHL